MVFNISLYIANPRSPTSPWDVVFRAVDFQQILIHQSPLGGCLTHTLSFNEVYKIWRNRARRYSQESIIQLAIEFLQAPAADTHEQLRGAPWQTLLLVKWICQDRMMNCATGRAITLTEFDELRQQLWKFPEQTSLASRDTLPGKLFFRQLIRPQIDFQREMTLGFIREGALLAQQPASHSLRGLFKDQVGIGIDDFLDLTYATYAAILAGQRNFNISWFNSLRPTYTSSVVDAYIACISRTIPQLVDFFRGIPDARRDRVASEYYEFPVLARYPFLRTGDSLRCWHPAVFYRGMEGFVHSVLSEAGQEYMHRFSGKIFERHVVGEARKLPATFYTEDEIRAWLPSGSEVPDGLLSYAGSNVFIESKAGLFDESVMTVGHSEMFSRKTKALRKAVNQAWSASIALRREAKAPANVISAATDYLLIVTNKELSASNGVALSMMYPPGTLDPANPDLLRFLPLERIYVLSIEDFERLLVGVDWSATDLPTILNDCVESDRSSETSRYYFEQHLTRLGVPRGYSELVKNAEAAMSSRLQLALSSE